MLNVSPEQVCRIIAKARAFDLKTLLSEQDREDDPRLVLEDYADDATLSELQEAIRSLDEDSQIDLVALTWLGRGDFEADEFNNARMTAGEVENRIMPDYLVGTPLLADFLENGLSTLGYSCRIYG